MRGSKPSIRIWRHRTVDGFYRTPIFFIFPSNGQRPTGVTTRHRIICNKARSWPRSKSQRIIAELILGSLRSVPLTVGRINGRKPQMRADSTDGQGSNSKDSIDLITRLFQIRTVRDVSPSRSSKFLFLFFIFCCLIIFLLKYTFYYLIFIRIPIIFINFNLN